MINLSVDTDLLSLSNPILTASGTFGYGKELEEIVNLGRLGGIVLKSVTKRPREGNPPPRVIETPSGMLNSIGLENPGIQKFEEETAQQIAHIQTTLIGSVAGFSEDEYVEVARRMEETGVIDAIELNISCPNTEERGICFGMDPQMTEQLTEAVKSEISIPLMVKLSPNVTDIQKLARAAVRGGADQLALINTLIGMDINWKEGEAMLGGTVGGLSGPAIRPVALRMVWEVAQVVNVPIVGIGGISSAEHVLKFLAAGAEAVQVGTATFVNPSASATLVEELETTMKEEEMNDLSEIDQLPETNAKNDTRNP